MIQIFTGTQVISTEEDLDDTVEVIGSFTAFIEYGDPVIEDKVWQSNFHVIKNDAKATHKNAAHALKELSDKLVEVTA